MNRKIFTACTAFLLGASVAWLPAAQAASFSEVQPYITDYKIGFTDGAKLVTSPVYDGYSRYSSYTTVTKAGKYGLLDNKTGKEMTSAIWDNIELISSGKIAIVQKGGWFQYLDLTTGKLSATKYAGGHAYYLSAEHDTVVAMIGQTSTLLDSSGKVLIPPFAGKLSMVQLMDPAREDDQSAEPVRYFLGSTTNQITLYDPVTFAPIFTLKNASLIPNEGGPKTAYLKVRSGGKEGLVGVDGKYALAPNYKALYFLNNGFVRVEGPKGVGLWKGGKMLVEPQYADVGTEFTRPDVYTTLTNDSITYHSLSKGTAQTFKKGAEMLESRYVLGQDPKTGLYGIAEIGGETLVPFAYPRVEGPPAARLLVRSDGKKGLIPGWGQPMAEPAVWFDSLTTIGGTYSMLSIQDGKRIGLYSDSKGWILEPQENTVIRYDERSNRILVENSTEHTTTAYGFDGRIIHDTEPREEALTDYVTTAGSIEKGYVLVDLASKQPISKAYRSIYYEGGETKLIVALDEKVADLYTPQGELLTKDIQIPLQQGQMSQAPVVWTQMDNHVYTAGVKVGSAGVALVQIADGQLQPVSDFEYASVSATSTSGHKLMVLQRTDGTSDVWTSEEGQMTRTLEQVSSIETANGLDNLFVQKGTAWDVYSPEGRRLSSQSYRALKYLTTGKTGAIAYQDQQTGLYGLLKEDGTVLTAAKFESIALAKDVFPGQWDEAAGGIPTYVYTMGQQFGYLDREGQELFQTAFLTKKPTITYRPMTMQSFPSYASQMRQNPLELLSFDQPYSWPAGVPSEQKFFANLALYLGLPKEAGRQEVLTELAAKGIIPANPDRVAVNDEDMFALSYFMETGQVSKMTAAQLWEWAGKRGLVVERGKMSYYQTMDLYREYHEMFFRELLRTPAGKQAAKAKSLSAATLTAAQQQMLTPMILVNGKAWEELALPLPQAEWANVSSTLVDQYNQQAAQLLAAYLKQNP
ncbi:WG repeat-containing protein [Brevibacillus nitrificans]|uniref:WG repeat-containing protein n=1 Tax=Brevibacillus nitrificans TaxID=651560 RepID=A0A3M8CUC5_9BACL|nr:WG repeat-containing protein [Brevibacillus nitrificans]RNB79119.1 WG repeat-containing protein [Brevibacillus nitrificans]